MGEVVVGEELENDGRERGERGLSVVGVGDSWWGGVEEKRGRDVRVEWGE